VAEWRYLFDLISLPATEEPIAPLHRVLVAGDRRLQHLAPTVGAADVARAQGKPFQIAKLVENEQRVITSAAKVAVVRAALLLPELTAS